MLAKHCIQIFTFLIATGVKMEGIPFQWEDVNMLCSFFPSQYPAGRRGTRHQVGTTLEDGAKKPEMIYLF